MITDKPSIAELQRLRSLRSPTEPLMVEVHAAAPVLLEIAAAALAYENAQCDSTHCDHPAHRGGCAILKADDFVAAVRRIRASKAFDVPAGHNPPVGGS